MSQDHPVAKFTSQKSSRSMSEEDSATLLRVCRHAIDDADYRVDEAGLEPQDHLDRIRDAHVIIWLNGLAPAFMERKVRLRNKRGGL